MRAERSFVGTEVILDDDMKAVPGMVPLCEVSEVPDEGGLRVSLEGIGWLAAFRVGEDYLVVADRCTHGRGRLSEGEVRGEEVECPFHQGAFNLRTGAPTAAPCTVPLKTYSAKVVGGTIYVALDEAG